MKLVTFLLFLSLTHCVSTEHFNSEKDLIIADVALKRAKKASADKYFPKSYSQAKNLYKKALFLFQQERSHEAKKHFQKSIEISEQIELYSLYKKKKDFEP